MDVKDAALSSVGKLPQDDVVHLNNAHATAKHDDPTKMNDVEIPPKKRKTRRGKCKRRNIHPYIKKEIKSNKVVKPEAPYNSNRFLIEDHGNIDEIDEQLRNTDQISTSTVTRTRDSSFSIDSDGEFYSTPDDEEEFLIKDFDDQYESLQAERLHAMTKNELIEEYLLLESRVELLTKRLRNRMANSEADNKTEENSNQQNDDFQKEIERLQIENENLKQENETLRNKQMLVSCTSDSEDSETDSSDSCSTTSTSSMSKSSSPVPDCPQINGHSPTVIEEAA
ncbi:hypothetical protein AMK59_8078 [Oryctes borbonicus]|uniref:HEXIM P-TEFb complex subunit 1 n=1 Tax=Oryctes borbonicus TaxID=1629725 RepID=A0A0T6AX08_9SCAR|nr:hypothetical protein AMK59_8078 [Oryctes borbonicus]